MSKGLMRLFLFIALFSCGISTPQAGVGADPNFRYAPPDSLSDEDATPTAYVSEQKAYEWAAGATLIPLLSGIGLAYLNTRDNPEIFDLATLLIVDGAFVGPSMGEYYAGAPVAATMGIVARVGGAAILALGALEQFGDCWNNDDDCGDNGTEYAGLFVFGASMLYNFIDTHSAVERNNEKARLYPAFNFNVVPEFSFIPNHAPLMGAKASLSF